MSKKHWAALFQRMLVLCWVFLISTAVLKIFGIEAFAGEIESEAILSGIDFINRHSWARAGVNIIKGLLGLNLMFACVITEYRQYILPINGIILGYLLAINTVFANERWQIIVGLLAFGIYAMPLLFKENAKACFKLAVVDSCYISLSLFMSNLSLIIKHSASEEMILASADYYLLWVITLINFKIGGSLWRWSLEHGQAFLTKAWKASKGALTNTVRNCSRQARRARELFCKAKSANLRARLKIYLKIDAKEDIKYKVIPIVVIFGLYALYAKILDRQIEAVFLYIAYLSLRAMFPKHFHADYIPGIKNGLITVTCVCMTSITLCAALYNSAGIGFSIFNTVIVAAVVDSLLYGARVLCDLHKKYLDDFTRFGFTPETARIAYDWKVQGLNDAELLTKYPKITPDALTKRKNRINKKLNVQ